MAKELKHVLNVSKPWGKLNKFTKVKHLAENFKILIKVFQQGVFLLFMPGSPAFFAGIFSSLFFVWGTAIFTDPTSILPRFFYALRFFYIFGKNSFLHTLTLLFSFRIIIINEQKQLY
ncbi:MAG: hypothetical protein ISS02_02170 [Candidatus Portnoybacteria bacterium]|nr:hypothetical protein [Candidatus Portnoybacteria bacterium]